VTGSAREFVERLRDDGQWFDRGVRVEYFRTASDSRELHFEKAALGSYEVLGRRRVEADGRHWLDVKMRRIPHAWTSCGRDRNIGSNNLGDQTV
jgi:hypothetical protein